MIWSKISIEPGADPNETLYIEKIIKRKNANAPILYSFENVQKSNHGCNHQHKTLDIIIIF